jgi:GT2 family glycosyltransferase
VTRISIAMAYRDRKRQLVRTLRSIATSAMAREVEVVVADDASRPEQQLDDLVEACPYPLRVIRLEPEKRWWVNPCVPFNRAIAACSGELLIVQNPECFHLGDVLADAVARAGSQDYVAYGCYSLDRPTTEALGATDDVPSGGDRAFVERVRQQVFLRPHAMGGEGQLGWYNHSRFRPVAFHFCAAIRRTRMEDLGGFDERFAEGVGFDDDELLARVRRLGLHVAIVDDPCVLHQWHYTAGGFGGLGDTARGHEAFRRNEALYRTVTLREMGWKANG